MSGILEKMQSQLNTIVAMLEAQGLTVTTTAAETPVIEEPQIESEADGLLIYDDFGVPWCDTINTADKKKGQRGEFKGRFKKKQSVSMDEYNQRYEALKNGKQRADEQKATPPPPGQAGATPPPPPATGATPPPPAIDKPDPRAECVEAIQLLCEGFEADSGQFIMTGVSPQVLAGYYNDQFGCADFSGIAAQHYQQVLSDVADWQNTIDAVNASVGRILEIYSADTSVIATYITQALGAQNIGLVPHAQLSAAKQAVAELLASVDTQ